MGLDRADDPEREVVPRLVGEQERAGEREEGVGVVEQPNVDRAIIDRSYSLVPLVGRDLAVALALRSRARHVLRRVVRDQLPFLLLRLDLVQLLASVDRSALLTVQGIAHAPVLRGSRRR
jgi:hypothetical protein